MVDTTLLERLVERAVAAHTVEMRGALWVQNSLLTELIRQLSKEAALQVGLKTDEAWMCLSAPEKEAARASWDAWRLYLMQRGGIVEDETPPQFHPLPQVSAPPLPDQD